MTNKSVSPLGLSRIQAFEGYQSAPVQLADGRWLCGHGHVAPAPPVKPLTRAFAEGLLRLDLAPAERAVNALVMRELTQSQFDALVSFAFSIGVGAFAKSEVLRRANEGEWAAAACAMDAWRKSAVSGESEVVEALVRRRAQEKAMLVDAPESAPSAWLKPELDHAAAILAAPVRIAPLPQLVAQPGQFETPPAAEEPLTLVHRIANDFAGAKSWSERPGLAALFVFGAALAGFGALIYFRGADLHAAALLLVPGLAAAGLTATRLITWRRARAAA
jgi:GH24 family phage-related lysozyme (muramidase)